MCAHATHARLADRPFALQGLSQDQLAAALPSIDVLRVAECLNSLLNRVRSRSRFLCARVRVYVAVRRLPAC
jgi:hypothetical protein